MGEQLSREALSVRYFAVAVVIALSVFEGWVCGQQSEIDLLSSRVSDIEAICDLTREVRGE